MPLFAEEDQNSIYFSMYDEDDDWSRNAPYSFELEGKQWPTLEHYFQAMRFSSETFQERIRETASAEQAIKLGKSWLKQKRADWQTVKTVVMTRGVYIRCRTYPALAERLLATDTHRLVENSQYDYFWGCGRDRRGKNQYGQVLMNVRAKLNEEREANAPSQD